MHPGSKETFEYIAAWAAPNLFFSVRDQWHRMGFLGMFGDYVLSCTPGDIVEIGVGESSLYLARLAEKYGRRIFHCDASPSKIENPATVPGYFGDSRARTVFCPYTSDEMFKLGEINKIALGFIDGDHIYDQAKADFWNMIPLVVDNGYVLLHDTYPPDESYIDENRCGGVYRLRQDLERNPHLDVLTLPRGTAMGVGLTIVRKPPADVPTYQKRGTKSEPAG